MRRFLLFALVLGGAALAWLFLREGGLPDGEELTRQSEEPPVPALMDAPDVEDAAETHLVGAPGAREAGASAGNARAPAAIRGVVFDPEGAARHSSVVELWRWEERTTSHGKVELVQMQVGTRRTGGDGRFAFADLEPGRYWASALAPPGLLAGRVDLELKGEDADVGIAFRRSLSARLLVETASGEPIEGARVTASRGQAQVESGVTDASGKVTLHGLDPEWMCRLLVKPPRSRYAELFDAPRQDWRPGDERIVLEDAYVVAGRVVDDEGAPVARAVVAHLVAEGTKSWALHHTKSDGTFRIGRLTAGPVTLAANPPGVHSPREGASVTVEAGRRDVVLTVSRGAHLKVEITNWEKEWTVHGGLGSIVLTPEGGEVGSRSFKIRPDATAVAGALEEGVSYVLWGKLRTLPGHYLHRTGVRVSAEPLRVRVETGGTIQGRVSHPGDVWPLQVVLSGPGVNKRGILDPVDGTFLIPGVPPGRWTVLVLGSKGDVHPQAHFDPKREVWWAECTAAAGEELELELERYVER